MLFPHSNSSSACTDGRVWFEFMEGSCMTTPHDFVGGCLCRNTLRLYRPHRRMGIGLRFHKVLVYLRCCGWGWSSLADEASRARKSHDMGLD